MTRLIALVVFLTLTITGCTNQPGGSNTLNNQPIATSSPPPTVNPEGAIQPVTLPVLDAILADEAFTAELRTNAALSEDELNRLRTVAREETAKLREDYSEDYAGTTSSALDLSSERVTEIVGREKAARVFALVRDRWLTGGEADQAATNTGSSTGQTATPPNAIPKDTRVVVNSPAYRMDVFENGELIKSYKIGIGYPEFPLPTGLRQARTIIFNPSWTPPDEPWVESSSSNVRPGRKVQPGSKLNPLGMLKIPIGSPSLIHGGKSPAKLGTFASHGCVGLTDPLAQDFAKVLARVSGTELTDAEIAAFKRARDEEKPVNLGQPIPVELRYETLVVEDGKLHIYRDVYDRDTNTEDNLRAVLQAYGVALEDFTEEERTRAMEALRQMSRDAKGRDITSPSPSPEESRNRTGRVTRTVKGQKEIVIDVAVLKGKGYPTFGAAGDRTTRART